MKQEEKLDTPNASNGPQLSLNIASFLILIPLLTGAFSCNLFAQQPKVEHFETKLPPRFEPNKGQIADYKGNLLPELKYVYRAPGMKMGLKKNGFVYNLYTIEKDQKPVSEATSKPLDQFSNHPGEGKKQHVTYNYHRVEVKFLNANEDVKIKAKNKTEGYANYYLGHCPEGIINVHGYQKLIYKNLYDNIDLVLKRKQNEEGQEHLKYDIIIHPGGDLSEIKMHYKGMGDLSVNNDKLQITTSQGKITETIPSSYFDESKEAVEVKYDVNGNEISFQTQKKKKKQTLFVDPSLSWSTCLGGDGNEEGKGVATDDRGNLFVVGSTVSPNFPTTKGSYQESLSGGIGWDAFLSKFKSNGQLIWSTFLGGNNRDYGEGVATNGSEGAIIAGITESSGFPTKNAHQNSYAGGSDYEGDVFLSKFSSGGKLKWSTFFGGKNGEIVKGITTDYKGNAYITGRTKSSNFHTTNGPYQNSSGGAPNDASFFLSKFNSAGSLSWSTLIGSYISGIASDNSGNVYITGDTESSNFPTTSEAYQNSLEGYSDVFLTKFSDVGRLIWSTLLGGRGSEGGTAVATDKSGNAFITGSTVSNDFPTTQSAYQRDPAQTFLTKFSSGGDLDWSTFLGGNDGEIGYAVATDNEGNVFLTGKTRSSNFPVTNGAYQNSYNGGIDDVFFSKFTSTGSLSWSTFLGGDSRETGYGVATDGNNNAFVTGETNSSNFPTRGRYQESLSGGADAFLSKFGGFGSTADDRDCSIECFISWLDPSIDPEFWRIECFFPCFLAPN